MKLIAFVLWLVLWPVATEVTDILHAIACRKVGFPFPSKEEMLSISTFEFITWVFVAIMIWKNHE